MVNGGSSIPKFVEGIDIIVTICPFILNESRAQGSLLPDTLICLKS
jgi:hypothetical protein